MKKNILLMLMLSGIFLFCGCATQQSYSAMMDGWRGKPVSEVIRHKNWGPATRVTPDGQGGLVYTWLRNNYIYHFYANPDGIIYTWKMDVNDYRGGYI